MQLLVTFKTLGTSSLGTFGGLIPSRDFVVLYPVFVLGTSAGRCCRGRIWAHWHCECYCVSNALGFYPLCPICYSQTHSFKTSSSHTPVLTKGQTARHTRYSVESTYPSPPDSTAH